MKKLSKKSKKILIIVVCFLIFAAAAGNAAYLIISPYYRPVYSGVVWKNSDVSEEESLLYNFIKTKMSADDNGIYTNYIDEKSQGDITKGHWILSESEGIMLLYNLERDNKEEFDLNLKYITENMIMKNNLLSWRIEDGNQNHSVSSIDDLRVIKALLLADEKWHNMEYRRLALKIAGGIRKELVDDEYRISNLNDGYTNSDITDLCYCDVSTLRMLSNIDYRNWKKIYDRANDIIAGGYISDEVPLYAKEYNSKEKTYDANDADTTLSMIVILNKLENAEDVSISTSWIKDKFKQDGKIFSSYSRENGQPTSDIESTAAYSFIVEIASKSGDFELETMAMNRMKAFQVKNPNSEVYGGFGDENGNNVFSYNNLNALLAFSMY